MSGDASNWKRIIGRVKRDQPLHNNKVHFLVIHLRNQTLELALNLPVHTGECVGSIRVPLSGHSEHKQKEGQTGLFVEDTFSKMVKPNR